MDSENPNMRKVNKNFQAFSDTYFGLLNDIRKINSLPARGIRYRTTFYLYKQKNAKKFDRNQTLSKAFKITILGYCFLILGIIFIISSMQLAKITYQLILYLYNSTS
jgi:hypothetical protein